LHLYIVQCNPRGQCPRWIWYSWINNFSNFLYPHAITMLLYRMKPRTHIYARYCWQAYFKSIGTLSRICRLNNELICTCTLCNAIKFVAVSRFYANYVCTLLIYTPIDVKYTVINNIFRHVGSLVDRYVISVSQMTTYIHVPLVVNISCNNNQIN
jgi:hypothetical protein